jgi:hypothetical protein
MKNLSLIWVSSLALLTAASSLGCGDDTSSGGNGGSGASNPAGGNGGTPSTGGAGAGPTGGGGESEGGGGNGTGGEPGVGGAGGAPVGCSGNTPVALTVKNYLSWCTVTVEDGAGVAGPTQTVCVPEGPVDVAAIANSGFKIGETPWHDTDGDSGAGEQGNLSGSGQNTESAAVVTVSGTSGCVWVCCEFANGGGCDVPDQCP